MLWTRVMTDSALSDTIILYVVLCFKLNFGFVKSVSLLLDVQPTKKECQYNITYPPLVHQSSFVVSFVGHTWKTWMWTHLKWAVSYCESESQAWTFSVVVGQVMGQYLSLFLPKSIYLSQRGVFLNAFSELMWYHLWFLGTSGKNCTWHFV